MTDANQQPTKTPEPDVTPADDEKDMDDAMSLNSLVGEYERESQRIRLGDDGELIYEKRKQQNSYEKPKRGMPEMDFEPHMAYSAIPIPSESSERNISALVFAMPLLMVLFGALTAGFGVPLMLLITLIIYLSNKDRSEFIRQNTFEALKSQVIGTVGWIGAIVALSLLGVVATVVLAITIVGVLLIPFLWLAIAAGIMATVAMPIWMVIFGAVGAFKALQGETYQYPVPSFIRRGRWRHFNIGDVRINI
jgi:uncharacterized Tic20 family protein